MQVKQLLDGHLPDTTDLGKMESESIGQLINDEATTGEAFRQASDWVIGGIEVCGN